jgi:hypothetical protein
MPSVTSLSAASSARRETARFAESGWRAVSQQHALHHTSPILCTVNSRSVFATTRLRGMPSVQISLCWASMSRNVRGFFARVDAIGYRRIPKKKKNTYRWRTLTEKLCAWNWPPIAIVPSRVCLSAWLSRAERHQKVWTILHPFPATGVARVPSARPPYEAVATPLSLCAYSCRYGISESKYRRRSIRMGPHRKHVSF